MRDSWGRLVPLCLGAGIAASAGSCGANDKLAPAAAQHPEQCESFSQMAPAFVQIIENESAGDAGQTPPLKYVIQNYLLTSPGPGQLPPIVTLLRVAFGTLNTFANDPPEPGASTASPCDDANPPAPPYANRICELRRMLDVFVHQGKGLTALNLIDPVVYDVFGYIRGTAPLATTPHYEIADFLSRGCGSQGVCKIPSVFDLLAGVLTYLRPPTGTNALNAIVTLWNDQNLTGPNGFLTNLNVQGKLGEDGFVALGQFLLSAILQMKADSTYFDNIQSVLNQFIYPNINDTQYPGLRSEIDAVVAALKDMLDPTRSEPILQPLQDAVYCEVTVDQTYFNNQGAFLRMVYRLSFVDNVLGMKDLLQAFQGLASIDTQGIVIETLHSLVIAFRQDSEGMSALASVCQVALTDTPDSSGQANAERVVPVMADLFNQGAVQELLCVSDAFLYGCTGGPQPACAPAQK